MTLYHHDDRPLIEAVIEAHNSTRQRFEKRIEEGRAQAATILEKIQTEVPTDEIVRTEGMTFSLDKGDLLMQILDDHEERRLHENALGQFAGLEDVPEGYLKKLKTGNPMERELAVHTMNQLAKARPRRMLSRRVGSEVRGLLSDSYRRLDSRPLAEAFVAAAMSVNALPVGGYGTDLRVGLRAIWPHVIDVDGEPVLFGVEWRNSDYGVGGHELRSFVERLWCTNLAVRENLRRQVHLGGRLPDDVRFSQRTYDLDTKASASALSDIVKANISEAAVERDANAIRMAKAKNITEKEAKALLERALGKSNKGEIDAALKQWAQNPYVEQLPPGPSVWRLSNAVSWLARSAPADRRIELQEAAGWLLPKAA